MKLTQFITELKAQILSNGDYPIMCNSTSGYVVDLTIVGADYVVHHSEEPILASALLKILYFNLAQYGNRTVLTYEDFWRAEILSRVHFNNNHYRLIGHG